MFTGIIEGTAKVRSISKAEQGADVSMTVQLGKLGKGLRVGDSVSVSGACLTVTRLGKGGVAEFQMVAETIRRTSLGLLKKGDSVNIERSLKIGDRLEGHFVLGHVDGTGRVDEIVRSPAETTIWIRIDRRKEIAGSLVSKGSITVDGVSLTVVDVEKDGERISVSLIPHTLQVTTFGSKKKGDLLNIETDILGKYVTSSLAQPNSVPTN